MMERRIATIVAADLVGYSRLMAADEEGTISRLRDIRARLVKPEIASNGGRIVKTMGDGLLVEFSSPVKALRCVTRIQDTMATTETGPGDTRMKFRIGINLGDVVDDDGDILGDGVNIAARLETLSSPGGAVISRSVRDIVQGKLDVPLTPMGPQRLKNIPDPVEAWRLDLAGADAPPMQFELPEKPSIIVLPFENQSPDPEQAYFCDGLSTDVTAALGRFRQLFVIARNTALTYKGKTADIREISQTLGVQYVLEGSVRSAGGRLRVAVQLIDAVNDRHLWSEKYDGELANVFDFQDDVTDRVVAAVAPEVTNAEIARARRNPTTDLSVWALHARARAEFLAFTPESMTRTCEIAHQAIGIDPGNSESHAILAEAHCLEALYGWNRPPAGSLELSMAASKRAIELDRRNEHAMLTMGFALVNMRRHTDALLMARKALKINPNSTDCMSLLGIVLVWERQYDEAIEVLNAALRLGPHDHWGCYIKVHLGVAAFYRHRFEETIAHCDDAHNDSPQNPTPLRLKTTALGHMGRLEDARKTLRQLQERIPNVSLEMSSYAVISNYPEDVEFFLEGLRLAGMPE